MADQPQQLLQREASVDEVLEQIGKGSSSMLPGPGGINEMCVTCCFGLPRYQSSGNKEHFLEVPKGPEEPQIWKNYFLIGTMVPEKVELTDI